MCIQGFSLGNLRERHQLEDLDIEGKIILKWIFRNLVEEAELNCSG